MAVTIKGLEGLTERLKAIADEDKVKKGLSNAVLLLEGEAAKKAPKGEIQQSITSKVDGMEGMVFSPHEKAPYYEYGTGRESIHPMGGRKDVPWVYVEGSENNPPSKRKYTLQEAEQAVAALQAKGLDARMTYGMKPQPFMRPAFDENRDKIIKILGGELLND